MNGMFFFLIHKQISPTIWKPVYKSEIKAAAHGRFNWNIVNLLTTDLAGDDVEREIRVDFLQSQKSGKHKHMGQSTMTIAGLKEGQREFVITDKKQKPVNGDHLMKISELAFKQRHSFLEYVMGGCEINLAIAIDFTLSNGRQTSHNSLHNINNFKNN